MKGLPVPRKPNAQRHRMNIASTTRSIGGGIITSFPTFHEILVVDHGIVVHGLHSRMSQIAFKLRRAGTSSTGRTP